MFAQFPGLTLPPSGNNQKASVTQYIGPVKVTIDYSSPAVHGPAGPGSAQIVDRRGKIWGGLIPYGMTNLGFGPRKEGPWRAGANENTTFTVSHPVHIEGKPLPAGSYGFHIVVQPDEWTLIFSKDSTSWGSFFYDPALDALRVGVKPRKHEYREHLTYEFSERKPDSAIAELQWEDLSAAWKIEVPKVEDIYVSQLRKELSSSSGFNWGAWDSAAQYALAANVNLEEALKWSEYSISAPFVGQSNFTNLSTKAQILAKLNRLPEAELTMRTALSHPATTPGQIHQYGRSLLAAGKKKDALEVFELNVKRNGESWPTHVGMARGLQAMGDYAKALEHAKKAAAQAPDPLNKKGMEQLVQQLTAQAGK
ncbi:MAG: DUF2911 domain-containing protein [Acidobacteria bacterium]|nr:DUF2911 domain-containing protein [Acidobacteriota bacterium]